MTIDSPTDRRPMAVVYADVIGSKAIADRDLLARSLEGTVTALDHVFRPGLVEPFAVAAGDEIRGALADAPHAPLCVSLLREQLAPIQARVAVVIDIPRTPADTARDPFGIAEDALVTLKESGRLTGYSGTGPAGDLLLNAVCRLVEPLLDARSEKQWEAIEAYRRLGQQRAVAEELGVTRQSVGDRLNAGHWRAVEDADTAIAGYLSYVCT